MFLSIQILILKLQSIFILKQSFLLKKKKCTTFANFALASKRLKGTRSIYHVSSEGIKKACQNHMTVWALQSQST